MRRILWLLPLALVFSACAGAQHLVDTFNPNGIGLGDEAEVQRGPLSGETVTVSGYTGGSQVEVTRADGSVTDVPLAHLGVQSNTYYWCVGQWEWVDFGGFFGWAPPHRDILVGAFDLRTLKQAGQPGGIPDGYGIFLYSEDPADLTMTCKTDAGEEGRALTSSLEKTGIATRLGVESAIEPVTICGVLLDIAVNKHDEIGVNPLEKSRDGLYRIIQFRCEGLPPFE